MGNIHFVIGKQMLAILEISLKWSNNEINKSLQLL